MTATGPAYPRHASAVSLRNPLPIDLPPTQRLFAPLPALAGAQQGLDRDGNR